MPPFPFSRWYWCCSRAWALCSAARRQPKNEQKAVIELIAQSTSPDFSGQIDGIIEAVKNQAPVGGPLGMITLLLGAIALFAQIDSAFDRIWSVGPAQHASFLSWLHRVLVDRLKAFLMLLGLGVLVMASFIMSMVLATLATYVEDSPMAQFGWRVMRAVSIVAFNSLLFTTLFKVLPRVPVRWHRRPGGLLTAIIWEIGRQLLALVVIGKRYSSLRRGRHVHRHDGLGLLRLRRAVLAAPSSSKSPATPAAKRPRP